MNSERRLALSSGERHPPKRSVVPRAGSRVSRRVGHPHAACGQHDGRLPGGSLPLVPSRRRRPSRGGPHREDRERAVRIVKRYHGVRSKRCAELRDRHERSALPRRLERMARRRAQLFLGLPQAPCPHPSHSTTSKRSSHRYLGTTDSKLGRFLSIARRARSSRFAFAPLGRSRPRSSTQRMEK